MRKEPGLSAYCSSGLYTHPPCHDATPKGANGKNTKPFTYRSHVALEGVYADSPLDGRQQCLENHFLEVTTVSCCNQSITIVDASDSGTPHQPLITMAVGKRLRTAKTIAIQARMLRPVLPFNPIIASMIATTAPIM